jgi:Family of unknown function (DUF6338)
VAIPSSVLGLLIFILLLWPGFVYAAVRDRNRPWQRRSPLRETVTIASVSLTALAVVLGIFGVLRAIAPDHTPHVRPLLFTPRAYLQTSYVSVGWWATGLLALAVLGSAGVAWARSSPRIRRWPGGDWIVTAPHPSQMSSWWLAFSEYSTAEYEHHVGCTLDDGSYVAGVLYAYSREADEGPDRDLVLRAPLQVRAAGATDLTTLERAGLMTVSARHIVTMTVTYVAVGQPASSDAGAAAAGSPAAAEVAGPPDPQPDAAR